jgi:predicted MPP superfamily phosphohydrolase
MNSNISRRDFFRIIKHAGTALTAALATSYYGFEFEPEWLDVVPFEINLPHLPKVFDGFRIVQISDIHMGGWMNRERLAEVLKLAGNQRPDLVVVTGDHVIGHSWSKTLDDAANDFVKEMSVLTAEYPVIGVMGNHDYWTDVSKVQEMLLRCGVVVLQNNVHTLAKDGGRLHIAGLDDVYEEKESLVDLYAKLPVNTEDETILLVHEPDFADKAARQGRFGLQLSGHSHGGQVVIPFFGPPVLPRWGSRYPAGIYRVGEMWLYTNRGVGMTSPFVRFNCRPEITVFTLRAM